MPGVCYTPPQKLEIARALADIGVHVMSVGFPAASAGDRRTLQLVMDAKRRGELGDVEIVVMCRSNRNDIDVTVKTLRDAGIEPSEVTFFIFTSGSDLHLKYKIGKTLLRFEGRDEREWLDLPARVLSRRKHPSAVRRHRSRPRVRRRTHRVRRRGRQPRRRRLLHPVLQSRHRGGRDASGVAGYRRYANAGGDALVLLAHRRGAAGGPADRRAPA